MLKIGIIGSSGFVKNFIKNYLNKKKTIFLIFEHKTKVLKLEKSKIFKGDLTNIKLNQDFFIESNIIINFSNPEKSSLFIASNLIKLCEKNKVTKLIHISTCEVLEV